MSELLRLEADDPAVLDRTGAALEISVGITRPPVKFVCGRCGLRFTEPTRPGYRYVVVSADAWGQSLPTSVRIRRSPDTGLR